LLSSGNAEEMAQNIKNMPTQQDTYRPLPTRQDSLIRAAILGENLVSKPINRPYEHMHDFLIFNPYQNYIFATKTTQPKK
jgi:hypothetical protein